MAFDDSIRGYLSLDCILRVLDVVGCMLRYCIHLGHGHTDYDDRFILIEDSDTMFFFCVSLMYSFKTLTCWVIDD